MKNKKENQIKKKLRKNDRKEIDKKFLIVFGFVVLWELFRKYSISDVINVKSHKITS